MSTQSAYHVADLTAAEIDRSFPLVEAARAVTGLDEWRRVCEAVLAPAIETPASQWLFVCSNALGYIKGVCLARLRTEANVRILEVPIHVVATAVDDEGVHDALEAHLRSLAVSLGAIDGRMFRQGSVEAR